mmetsp:Transcript_25472/g.39458  ORF Transcript_25472/g.39458 Transcript_25472/m.39458 type:complete len:474 (-) Transcript_25472:205-1626(-)|eukprot:CAMPEP_0196814822 /NCGR_PEP_ID=MMETSP1362-20130617/45972_1 /TAXON_ID=163516 /ORGANISM="Leptocylindrus danicus, Strain CCMP1856" /LENGTH=473 /DNA_ID=CAMNT_0042191569 /DNA_START=61 /DNA_END=1482 /DNA_ORIENTATION=+
MSDRDSSSLFLGKHASKAAKRLVKQDSSYIGTDRSNDSTSHSLNGFMNMSVGRNYKNKSAAFLPTQTRGYADSKLSYGSMMVSEISDENEQFSEARGGENGDDFFDPKEVEKEGIVKHLLTMCLTKPVSPLLLALPFAYISYHQEWSPVWIFWLNFLGMVPLASILGDFTEELALHTNQVIGGLINATFGNIVEVVVAINALRANEIRVVQASMIGSIFSNLLLVLGCCFFFGGLGRREQRFNATGASANISLLALSSMALVLPTPFAVYYDIEDADVLSVSRTAAIFLMTMYMQLLVFQLKTHADLFEDDDEDEPELPFIVAIAGLAGMTALITIFSDYLVDSIDGFTADSGVSKTFVGLIILPIVGNAVEHITAVTVAMKDKMDLAMGIAIGSSVQIALFVVPVIVSFGWIMDKDMTLNFPQFELCLYILSIIIVSLCVTDGSSNWLEGSLLITTYFMIAVGFWYEQVEDF